MKGIKLKPKFEDLNSGTFVNEFQELQKELEAEKLSDTNPFPVEVFPEPIQEIITATNECLNYPIDFIGASILYAVSVSIGNTHRVEVKKGWIENSVMYLSIVGNAGTNKSHPVSFALKPIEHRDGQSYQKYQEDKLEYDSIESLTKKERNEQGYDPPEKPVWKQYLVTDFTPESLADIHKFNKRGIGVYVDELASWFKNFNRYNKGSEEQLWLSVWSGKPIRINRKTTEPTYIPHPFISVIGTIQPGVLDELAINRTENGFLDRLLFVVPDNLKKEYWSSEDLDPVISENWEIIISNLLDLPMEMDETNNPKPEILKFTQDAKQLLFEWQKQNTDLCNEDESVSGIYSKIEMYAIRLALCLEMARYACNESDKKSVGINAMEGAIKLVEYFKKTALQVHTIVNSNDPLDKFPADKQALYEALPDHFTANKGTQVAKDMGMANRTFRRFITKRELFKKVKRGEYEKLL